MTDWTKPRAYIIRMTGAQTAVLVKAHMDRCQAYYAAHLAKLSKDNPPA